MGFSSWKTSLLSFLFGFTVPLVLPILQFGFVYRCPTFWKLITIPLKQSSHGLSNGSGLPYLAIHSSYGLVRLWEEHAVEVKRDYCQNSCWDTVFKVGTSTKISDGGNTATNTKAKSGWMDWVYLWKILPEPSYNANRIHMFKQAGYETGAGSYKHIYFNATWQAGAMWALTLFSALLLYEALRHLLGVWIAGRLRWRMAILALASIYPHYYGFWTLWGYLNDDFYEQVFYL